MQKNRPILKRYNFFIFLKVTEVLYLGHVSISFGKIMFQTEIKS